MPYVYTDASIKLKEEVIAAREDFPAALNRYPEIYSKVRNFWRRGSPAGPDVVVFHWPDAQIELNSLLLLEEKLQEAKVNFTQAPDLGATYSWAKPAARINKLPENVLFRVFQRVQVAEPCEVHLLDENGPKDYPRYPDYLAQVCARWRDIALAYPTGYGRGPCNFGYRSVLLLWEFLDRIVHFKFVT